MHARRGLSDDRRADVRVRRDVHDLDLRIVQKLLELPEHRLDTELLTDAVRRLGSTSKTPTTRWPHRA